MIGPQVMKKHPGIPFNRRRPAGNFNKMADESRKYAAELRNEVERLGGERLQAQRIVVKFTGYGWM
jgi:hypothetical protein